MIRLRNITFTYPRATRAVLHQVDLDLADGSFTLVVGASGSGKSTLLRVPSGLVPYYSGGTFGGEITIGKVETTGKAPRELTGVVGFVPQDPEAHSTSDRVVGELAFTMENLGIRPTTMRKRVEEVLDALSISDLRRRRLDTLSGGERQRVAIAAVLAALPSVLILDEPTSALDPQSAEDVISCLNRLRDEFGLTIVCSEHRLERVVPFADYICLLDGTGVSAGSPRDVLRKSAFAPPVTILGRQLGWEPLPVTVREGRLLAAGLPAQPPNVPSSRSGEALMRCRRLRVRLDGREILRGLDLDIRRGEISALVGRNGSGKTTLLRAMAGLARPHSGEISFLGQPGERARPSWRRARRCGEFSVQGVSRRVAYVPQRAEMLLFRDSLRKELESAALGPGDVAKWLQYLRMEDLAERHPWTLSAGQRLWAALATAFLRYPDVYLLDEPTRGLDAVAKDRLAEVLRDRADEGASVLLVTHDVELIARVADQVHMLAEGSIVASGNVREVLGESLLFSSQTSKVMGDPRFLVPDDVIQGLDLQHGGNELIAQENGSPKRGTT